MPNARRALLSKPRRFFRFRVNGSPLIEKKLAGMNFPFWSGCSTLALPLSRGTLDDDILLSKRGEKTPQNDTHKVHRVVGRSGRRRCNRRTRQRRRRAAGRAERQRRAEAAGRGGAAGGRGRASADRRRGAKGESHGDEGMRGEKGRRRGVFSFFSLVEGSKSEQ